MIYEILNKYSNHDLIIADGFDEAVIGIDERSKRIIYSMTKCIKILMKDMKYSEALEYFYYNVIDAHVGEQTPIWCDDIQNNN